MAKTNTRVHFVSEDIKIRVTMSTTRPGSLAFLRFESPDNDTTVTISDTPDRLLALLCKAGDEITKATINDDGPQYRWEAEKADGATVLFVEPEDLLGRVLEETPWTHDDGPQSVDPEFEIS